MASGLPVFRTLALFCLLSATPGEAAATPSREISDIPLQVRDVGDRNTRIMLHVTPARAPEPNWEPCKNFDRLPCRVGEQTFNTQAPLSSPETPAYFVYVIAANYESFRGIQFGIKYDDVADSGVDILSWTSCGAFEYPSSGWPASGTGNLMVFDCRIDRFTVVGYFTVEVHSPDVLNLVERQLDGALKVADCSGAETLLPVEYGGAVGFGGLEGEDPCFRFENLPPPPPPPLPPMRGAFMLHVVPAEAAEAGSCSRYTDIPCSRGAETFRTQAPLSTPSARDHLVYVLVKNPRTDRGVWVAAYEIEYTPGIVIAGWEHCGSHVFRYDHFPRSGGNTEVAWFADDGGCDWTPMRVVGFLTVRASSSGILRLRDAFASFCRKPTNRVEDYEFFPHETASVGFGDSPGFDPCLADGWEELSGRILTPVVPATWGRIKTLLE